MFVRSAFAFAAALLLGAGAFAVGSQSASDPTFSRDVASILYDNCTPCHNPGGPGPFSLLNYDEAKAHANEIAAATSNGYMPPFPPRGAPGTFEDEHRLSRAQIDYLARWVAEGMPEGDRGQTPRPPSFPKSGDWQLGPPDLVLEAAQRIDVRPDGP